MKHASKLYAGMWQKLISLGTWAKIKMHAGTHDHQNLVLIAAFWGIMIGVPLGAIIGFIVVGLGEEVEFC